LAIPPRTTLTAKPQGACHRLAGIGFVGEVDPFGTLRQIASPVCRMKEVCENHCFRSDLRSPQRVPIDRGRLSFCGPRNDPVSRYTRFGLLCGAIHSGFVGLRRN
jgi:hypothetical protein